MTVSEDQNGKIVAIDLWRLFALQFVRFASDGCKAPVDLAHFLQHGRGPEMCSVPTSEPKTNCF